MVDDRCAAGLGETDERTAPPAARKCDSVVALRRCTPERRLQQFPSETSPSQWLDDRDHGGAVRVDARHPDESPADHHAEAGPAPGGQVAERSGWQLGCGRAEEALLAEQLVRERSDRAVEARVREGDDEPFGRRGFEVVVESHGADRRTVRSPARFGPMSSCGAFGPGGVGETPPSRRRLAGLTAHPSIATMES